jgi:pimeloyl-ACP methyl ester carboxylesterase
MIRILLIAIGLFVVFVEIVFLHRGVRQHRNALALRIKSADGVCVEGFVPIGGIEQWITIRGDQRDNPALLLIHGGPGSSCGIFAPIIRSWERYFTVIQWDQRGSGKTFGRTGPSDSGNINMDRLIRDGIEVADHIRTTLRKEKVILVAHSLGTTFGLSMVRRRPELFSAYVGTDQNTGMVRGREENYKATIVRLRAAGLDNGVSALQKIGPDPFRWSPKDFTTVAKWTMKSHPATCVQIMRLLKSAVWFTPGYTLLDIRDFASGMHFSIERLLAEIRTYDAWAEGTHFAVPFFIFQGENDVVTPPFLAREFLEQVTAPVKHMELIRDAGHFAAFTQPEQFVRAMLAHVRPIAIGS